MNTVDILSPFCTLCLLFLLGQAVRSKARFTQFLHLPASIIAGLLGLVANQVISHVSPTLATHVATHELLGWEALPSLLINVVFANLFLGERLPPIKRTWEQAKPQYVYGSILSYGQYFVALLTTGLMQLVWNTLPPFFGVSVVQGFEGGAGTAAGMAETYESVGWAAGSDFALAASTVGLIGAILLGVAIANWAFHTGRAFLVDPVLCPAKDLASADDGFSFGGDDGLVHVQERSEAPVAGRHVLKPDSGDSLTVQLAVCALCIVGAMWMADGLAALESLSVTLSSVHALTSIPLFVPAMISGLIVQKLLQIVGAEVLLDRELINRVSGVSLDLLIVSAVTLIDIDTVSGLLTPFLIVVAALVAWHCFCFFFICPRLVPDYPVERGVVEIGHSMGVTSTGLLLLRIVDPDNTTPVLTSFGAKLLLHEPMLGGGIFTSVSVPFLAVFNSVWQLFSLVAVIMLGYLLWFLIGIRKQYVSEATGHHWRRLRAAKNISGPTLKLTLGDADGDISGTLQQASNIPSPIAPLTPSSRYSLDSDIASRARSDSRQSILSVADDIVATTPVAAGRGRTKSSLRNKNGRTAPQVSRLAKIRRSFDSARERESLL
jgi:ESS family glutamate:Na+ symporter